MSAPTFARRHRGSIAATAVVAAASSVLVAYAISADGYAARHVDLNDGGIWVTSNADGLYGRLNKPIGQLDAGFFPPGGAQAAYTVDVVQDGSAVLAFDKGAGKVFPVDVRSGAPLATQAAVVPGNDELRLAGSTAAVLDPSSGRLWAARVTGDDLSGLAKLDTGEKPVVTVGAGADLAVSSDGTIFAASAGKQQLVTIRPADGRFAKPAITELHHQMESLAITSVGDTPVVVDAKGGVALLPGGRTVPVPKDATDAVLQQPGPKSPAVYLATSSTLVSVPLGGGPSATLFDAGAGTPARPVVIGGCLHAAWGGTPGVYARSCNGKPAEGQKLPSKAKVSQPVFRVNRGQIVLNDLASGGVWVVDDAIRQVDDWQAIRPPKPKPNSKKPKNPSHEKQPSAQNRPPQPKDDTLGARLGRITVLHLLDNDSDPDGDILAITSVGAVDGAGATVSVSADGQTAQVAMPPSESSNVHFKYTVSDGKGGSGTADVTVEQRVGDANDAPTLRPGYQKSKVWTVAAGATFTYPVLPDWRDFDGDPLALVHASVPQGSAVTTADGSIVFTAPGDAGVQQIQYEVSDGIGDPVPGTLKVKVLARSATDAVAATAEPDVVRAVVGRPITITPLANDVPGSDPTDPSAKLALAAPLPQPIGAAVTTDLAGGTVTVTAKHVGTLSLKYQAAFGSAKLSTGLIRLDVVADPAKALPPVAMPDTAVLHGQQAATVDVLANDFDPSGDVLVVQRAVAADDAGLQIAVVQGHWLRLWSTQPVSPGVRLIHYTVTDGLTQPVTGEVSVLQLPAPELDAAPSPVDDLATVRAGDSVDVAVLDNDIDPDGDPMTLQPGKLVTTPEGTGAGYVSGNVLRYAAPPSVTTSTQVVVDYVAVDPSGQTAVGHARITINPVPADPAHDQPPDPGPVSRSVVAGDQVTITIPWTGVDPDGDSVTVAGIASPPRLGRITATGPTTLTYQAYPLSAGTDTFSYQVSDRFGLSGTATMRIGVVPPGDPQPPVAVDDNVTAAPGATVHVAVLGNDLTAPDDEVSIAPLAATNEPVPDGASLQDDRVVVQTPPATGKPLIVSYAITDGTGGRSEAQVIVDARPKYDIPPVARDDVAKVAPGATSATVDVLANDDDPDGTPDALTISRAFLPAAHVANRQLVVPVQAFPQAIAYEVRDHGGATSMALVHVPGNGTAQPRLRPDAAPIELAPAGNKTINVADYAIDPGGKPLRLTTTDQIWGSPDNGLAVASKGATTLELTAKKGYTGPASAVFEVTDGTSLADPRGQKALIAVPVQIGTPQPVLRCPSSTLSAIQGGAPLKLDIATVC
ncbi:MAG TPA: Ig-like domain-containing protein, partial [Kribbellaceae bacterium]